MKYFLIIPLANNDLIPACDILFVENQSDINNTKSLLTLQMLITTAADNSLIFFFYFSEKKRLDISCESSAKQMIHMKCQVLFCLKNNTCNNNDKKKYLLVALRVNRNDLEPN